MNKYDISANTARSTFYGLLLQVITMLGGFATKSLLIYKLGIEYVGLDGLFASILTFLNMAELGFSTAIVFKLYKPIAEGNIVGVNALLNYYRKIYRIIGLIVLICGLCIIPFLGSIVNVDTVPEDVNLYVIYLISLTSTVVTYWLFAYKTALFNAHQRNDMISRVHSMIIIGQYVAQIILLCIFRNYYTYLIVLLIGNVARNFGVEYYSRKFYPQYKCEGLLDKETKNDIKHKIEALIYNKIGVTIISSSGNIVISKFLGLVVLGIYVSYYFIFSLLYKVFDVLRNALTAGIGNRIVTDSVEQNYIMFKRVFFLYGWATGFCSICLACLYKSFMVLWVGEDKTMPLAFSIMMAVYFYFWLIRFAVLTFKSAQGLWWEDRFRPLCEGLINLILCLLVVRKWGLYGIVFSATTAMIIVSIPWETRVLFKHYFRKSAFEYCRTFIMWIAVTSLSGVATFLICSCINGVTIFSFIVRLAICLVVPNAIFYLMFRKSDGFKFAVSLIRKKIGSRLRHS